VYISISNLAGAPINPSAVKDKSTKKKQKSQKKLENDEQTTSKNEGNQSSSSGSESDNDEKDEKQHKIPAKDYQDAVKNDYFFEEAQKPAFGAWEIVTEVKDPELYV
jgi:hypothetical protein